MGWPRRCRAPRAYSIIQDLSGEGGDVAAHRYAGHEGVREYTERVRRWAVGLPGQSPADSRQANREINEALLDELHRGIFPPETRP
jgi:hypothetical protein